jgi:hypothetical protein
MNNEHVQQLQKRLIGLFEVKAQEFSKYSEENASGAVVAAQLAGLYNELVQVMKAA